VGCEISQARRDGAGVWQRIVDAVLRCRCKVIVALCKELASKIAKRGWRRNRRCTG